MEGGPLCIPTAATHCMPPCAPSIWPTMPVTCRGGAGTQRMGSRSLKANAALCVPQLLPLTACLPVLGGSSSCGCAAPQPKQAARRPPHAPCPAHLPVLGGAAVDAAVLPHAQLAVLVPAGGRAGQGGGGWRKARWSGTTGGWVAVRAAPVGMPHRCGRPEAAEHGAADQAAERGAADQTLLSANRQALALADRPPPPTPPCRSPLVDALLVARGHHAARGGGRRAVRQPGIMPASGGAPRCIPAAGSTQLGHAARQAGAAAGGWPHV